MTKKMKVPRGTERARRREGLQQGWRATGLGPRMQPAKVPAPELVSSHSVHLVSDQRGQTARSDAKDRLKLASVVGSEFAPTKEGKRMRRMTL